MILTITDIEMRISLYILSIGIWQRITKDGLWRVTYGENPGLSREEILARQPKKFEEILPGHPKADQYKMVNISPYKVHQRLAESMRVGRFLLTADAAHRCNPL